MRRSCQEAWVSRLETTLCPAKSPLPPGPSRPKQTDIGGNTRTPDEVEREKRHLHREGVLPRSERLQREHRHIKLHQKEDADGKKASTNFGVHDVPDMTISPHHVLPKHGFYAATSIISMLFLVLVLILGCGLACIDHHGLSFGATHSSRYLFDITTLPAVPKFPEVDLDCNTSYTSTSTIQSIQAFAPMRRVMKRTTMQSGTGS
ncbi:uncharacterized protein MYCGRDRAFT_97635 [Zymoseptoria tritici IPO323]|uniref:Uncharacterized protein n=1 Tax=Zymoseptoria tritici (strain CBS 115943 / IPO323) TaxID=336722 RepID=F9XR28_ZYMTI|nr:uncharacterized protein MYCGRDRAFT_97635 [Zymoseptoria tritici IPO323]EGP82290.1 hypothetical protein MYCGRDRAFT_97635 [Zymoseptoria tritici IPO323]